MEKKKALNTYLSTVAKQMVFIHDANLLSKLVLKIVTERLKVKHVGLFLYDKKAEEYVIKLSQGKQGLKIPVNFTKINRNSTVIKLFSNPLLPDKNKLSVSDNEINLLKKRYKNNKLFFKQLEDLEDVMFIYGAKLVVCGFFRNRILVLFFIGEKENGRKFTKDEISFLNILSSDVVMAIQNTNLFEDIKNQLEINKQILLNTVQTLATVLDVKNAYTHGHAERVMKYSLVIMKYIPKNILKKYKNFEDTLKISSLLHDIGKVGIPEDILNKSGKLTEEEFNLIKKHPAMGSEILEPIKEFYEVSLGVKYHHERYDGKGYPYKLAGVNIPLLASIISVADCYDAMLNDRPYRKGLAKDIVVNEIIANKNKQFSPVAVDAFIKAVKGNEM